MGHGTYGQEAHAATAEGQVTVDAALVAKLRAKTGAGVVLCKQALEAEKGDLAKAEEWLRARNFKPDVQARPAGEGLVAVAVSGDGRRAMIAELRCETDFAARSERFRALAQEIAEAALAAGADDATKAMSAKLGDFTVAERIKVEVASVVKENLVLAHVEAAATEGRIGTYVHSNGKLVAVVLATGDQVALGKAAPVLRDLAMHVAGSWMAPVAVSRGAVPADLIEAERRVIERQLAEDPKESQKPETVRAKIATGKLDRFYKERVLLEQPFVKDPSKTVKTWLEEQSKALGGKVEVEGFRRRQLGQ